MVDLDEPSSLGEAVMLGGGSIEHRELIYYHCFQIDNFSPPTAGLELDPGPGNAAPCAPPK